MSGAARRGDPAHPPERGPGRPGRHRRGGKRGAARTGGWLPAALLTAALATSLDGQAVPRGGCDLCHGELELLRRRAGSLDEARRLLAPAAEVLGSAHGALACADCHDGVSRFPHAEAPATRTCVSCHEEVEEGWAGDVHAAEESVACASCHGVHDVARSEADDGPAAVGRMNGRCTSCHLQAGYTAGDVHADTVACASCHGAHATRPAGEPGSRLSPAHQASTCGACHEEVAGAWTGDAHGSATARRAVVTLPPAEGDPEVPPGEEEEDEAPPACSTCHGAHPVRGTGEAAFARGVRGTCAGCHEPYAESFADSYHGQAAELGSERVATCSSCHTAHAVFPTEDARSSVSPGRVLETCRECHTGAGAGFAAFQPHADHHDRARYPHVWWSYRLMTGLLLGVFAAFGFHTLLWLARVARGDPRRGAPAAETPAETSP